MCGRFNIAMTSGFVELVNSLGVAANFENRYNVAPTEMIPMIIERDGMREILSSRWWLVPSWSAGPSTKYAMFNARAETMAASRAYKSLLPHKRCIIPVSSFIEWTEEKGGRQPHEITTASGAMALAGLWDYWGSGVEGIYSCTIVTTEAVDEFRHIHQRMPLILSDEEQQAWLDVTNRPEKFSPILMPHVSEGLVIHKLSKSVNNSRNKAPVECLGH